MKQSIILIISILIGSSFPSLEATMVKAEEEQKDILLYFSGSDWCLPCIRLKKEILEDTAFQSTLSEDVILYTADFPRKDKSEPFIINYKKSLAEKYNPRGTFPLLLLLNSKGDILYKWEGYQGQEVSSFVKIIEHNRDGQ